MTFWLWVLIGLAVFEIVVPVVYMFPTIIQKLKKGKKHHE